MPLVCSASSRLYSSVCLARLAANPSKSSSRNRATLSQLRKKEKSGGLLALVNHTAVQIAQQEEGHLAAAARGEGGDRSKMNKPPSGWAKLEQPPGRRAAVQNSQQQQTNAGLACAVCTHLCRRVSMPRRNSMFSPIEAALENW